jgi:hypothetical protein
MLAKANIPEIHFLELILWHRELIFVRTCKERKIKVLVPSGLSLIAGEKVPGTSKARHKLHTKRRKINIHVYLKWARIHARKCRSNSSLMQILLHAKVTALPLEFFLIPNI